MNRNRSFFDELLALIFGFDLAGYFDEQQACQPVDADNYFHDNYDLVEEFEYLDLE